MMMELGAYKVKLTKYPADKRLLVEVYTNIDDISDQQYCRTMNDIMHYLGAKGYLMKPFRQTLVFTTNLAN